MTINRTADEHSKLGNPGAIKRRAVSLASEDLVTAQLIHPEFMPVFMIRPAVDGVNLAAWAANHRDYIEAVLNKHGAILFRGFNIKIAAEFEQFTISIAEELLQYTYGSTPRTHISGNVYTSTEYPASEFIPLHSEMAYSSDWPMKIWFFCAQPAANGGETPIADNRKIYAHLDPKIREQFVKRGVMYVRNYGHGLDLSWETVFQTTDKSRVEDYCRNASIDFEWLGENLLRTTQVCQAVASHPRTNELVWFNQAHLFHISSLSPEIGGTLSTVLNEDRFPRNAYYGDGSPIEPAVLDEIRQAYRREMMIFTWSAGDILMLDNMLTAHGRMPYNGPRKVLVGMAESFRNRDI